MAKIGWYCFIGQNTDGICYATVNDANFDIGESRVLEALLRQGITHGYITLFKNGVLHNKATFKRESNIHLWKWRLKNDKQTRR